MAANETLLPRDLRDFVLVCLYVTDCCDLWRADFEIESQCGQTYVDSSLLSVIGFVFSISTMRISSKSSISLFPPLSMFAVFMIDRRRFVDVVCIRAGPVNVVVALLFLPGDFLGDVKSMSICL